MDGTNMMDPGTVSEGFNWMKILAAIGLGAMIIYLLPRARAMIEASAQAENKDWKGFLLPLAGVILFVIFLVAIVRH